jgi:hypothetical protein
MAVAGQLSSGSALRAAADAERWTAQRVALPRPAHHDAQYSLISSIAEAGERASWDGEDLHRLLDRSIGDFLSSGLDAA